MKNIFLSVVVVAALVAAGVGGTFADFSDIEISEDNFYEVGALDLTVSDYLGQEYNGDVIPVFWEIQNGWPCCDKSVYFDLENWGEGWQKQPWVYIHFKNMECYWTWPKLLYKMVLCDEDTKECIEEMTAAEWEALSSAEQEAALEAGFKPVTEPEYVAECGGLAGELADGTPVYVDGIGCFGETCEVAEHIGVTIWVAGPWPHDEKPEYNDPDIEWTQIFNDKLDQLDCQQFELMQLPNCNGIWVHAALHLQDIDEDDLGLHYFDEDIPAEEKWDHWPTNALQEDGVKFDMAFELLQNRVPQ